MLKLLVFFNLAVILSPGMKHIVAYLTELQWVMNDKLVTIQRLRFSNIYLLDIFSFIYDNINNHYIN